jgi:hypothetical protein
MIETVRRCVSRELSGEQASLVHLGRIDSKLIEETTIRAGRMVELRVSMTNWTMQTLDTCGKYSMLRAAIMIPL